METHDQSPTSGSQFLKMLRQRISDGTLRDVFRDWKWIFSFSASRWRSIVFYTLLGMASSSVSLLSGIASKYLIDCIVARDTARMIPLAVLMLLSGAFGVGLSSLTSRVAASVGSAMHNDVQAKVFNDLLHSRWLEIRRYPTGDLLNRFHSDASTVANCAVSTLPGLVIQIFSVIATLCVVLYYDPIMALIALASTPVMLVASRRLLRKQRSFTQKLLQVSSGISAFQTDVFHNIDTLKSFGVEDTIGQNLRRWQKDYRDTTLAHNAFAIKTNVLLSFMGMAVEYMALGYCLWRLWRGDILFGTMVLFLQQRTNLSNAFSSIVSLLPSILNGSVSAERIRALTELEKDQPQIRATPEGQCALEIRNVDAGYEGDRQVLSGVSLTAPAGQVVALVGPSGEGKTTLMRLMLGLLPAQRGVLYLTDAAGNRFDLGSQTRHLLTYVPQGNTVLSGTIAENLRLVAPEATEESMISALEDACAWEFVREMPGKLHASIGEGGKGLSEGQSQRIAIARALVRKAPVMLLDEVTSALDQDTERRVLDNLMNRGVTCILTTHRPSVLSLCKAVYRVQDGAVSPLTPEEVRNLTKK